MTTTNIFEVNHEDAYDSDVDEGPNAAVAFMANLSIHWCFRKPKKATNDLKGHPRQSQPGLGLYGHKRDSTCFVLIAVTIFYSSLTTTLLWDSEEGLGSPKELSQEQAYLLSANEIASQASNPVSLVTPFIHTRPPPSQVLANLQKVNAVFSNLKFFAAKSANARRVEAHHRTLNKKNRVDSNLLVKHSVSVSNLNNVCDACNKSLVFANHNDCLVMCDDSVNVKPHQTKRFKRQPKKEWKPIKNVGNPIKRVWKPISKPVANNKPQWKPTGRHFSLFEKYPLTRIMEPTDMPIELPPSASSSPQITMVSRFTDHTCESTRMVPKGSLAVQIVLWYLDSGCSRHMTGDRARLINFVEKFIGTVRFGNDEYAAIVGYGDYKLGDTIISRVYYVEGLKHNLFSVGQFCDGGLEVAFRQHSCHIRNYDMVDLLNGAVLPTVLPYQLNDMNVSFTSLLVQSIFKSKSWTQPLCTSKGPRTTCVPPTKKQVDDLFQWFDDDEVVPIPPVVPITPVNVPECPGTENANGYTITIVYLRRRSCRLLKASYLIQIHSTRH
ncbi:hypothetical protein Tco_0907111 [Tanacetum coccineum]|uniref:Retrovirus-related Pol polyprotein from transposon TNT 1-94-like beta-barrel domain-containing protein n=1 Tax=Tanacetum coccineum TaxID=301880 RepID=A0ABQ5CLU6_9ASTR